MTTILLQAALAASVSVSPGDDLDALTSSLGPGDAVVFTDGVYELEGTLTVEGVGEEGARVELFAQEGATPILKSLNGNTILEIRDSEHLTVRGLTFIGPDTWEEDGNNGVVIRDSSDVIFEDNVVQQVRSTLLYLAGDGSSYQIRRNRLEQSSNGHGIYAGCGDGACWLADSVIEQNLIRDLHGEPWQYGIVLDNGSQANTIADNVVYNLNGTGIRVESTQFGDPNWIERNAVWNGAESGIEVYGAARVRNNVVFEMGGYGIRSGSENDELEDVVITYNTVALTDNWAVRLDDWPDRIGMVFSSNCIANITGRGLFFDNDLQDDETDTTTYFTANVVSGLVEGIDISIYPDWFIPGAGVADFEDVAAWDFYPVNQSALVGSGDPAGDAWIPEIDFNGANRNGASPTIGAYEWDGNGNPGWVIQEDFKDLDALSRLPGGSELQGGCCSKKEDPTEAILLLPLLVFGLKRRRA
ncbi:MAG: right-handed parallel beta-helix repeat-containing protein [Alphaproteobacteria bacterium]|nr:right-handed parallel beta-helix repeat-containing protein [Alphaproteobacteria bacterium]